MAGPGKMSGKLGIEDDPIPVSHFFVDMAPWLDSTTEFREVTGLGSESEVIEYKAAKKDDFHSIRAVPGRLKWGKITFKRGVTPSMKIWDWRKEIELGNVNKARADGSIVLVDNTGAEAARWNFYKAWPTKINGPAPNSGTNDFAIEEMEIVHERLERIK